VRACLIKREPGSTLVGRLVGSGGQQAEVNSHRWQTAGGTHMASAAEESTVSHQAILDTPTPRANMCVQDAAAALWS
jgi:hypothetical protein